MLARNPVFGALDSGLVPRRAVRLDTPVTIAPGLTATLFAVPGKVPLYLEGEDVRTDLVADTNRWIYQSRIPMKDAALPPLALPSWD